MTTQHSHSGVIPGRGPIPSGDSSSRRLTFMVGFWKKICARPRGLDQPGPGQPFPCLTQSSYTWPREMALDSLVVSPAEGGGEKADGLSDGDINVGVNRSRNGESGEDGSPKCVTPLFVPRVWQDVDVRVAPAGGRRGVESGGTGVPYTQCFQGF